MKIALSGYMPAVLMRKHGNLLYARQDSINSQGKGTITAYIHGLDALRHDARANPCCYGGYPRMLKTWGTLPTSRQLTTKQSVMVQTLAQLYIIILSQYPPNPENVHFPDVIPLQGGRGSLSGVEGSSSICLCLLVK